MFSADSKASAQQIAHCLLCLAFAATLGCTGSVGEVADGDEPDPAVPNGTIEDAHQPPDDSPVPANGPALDDDPELLGDEPIAATSEKHRVIILTDIGEGDPDDEQSMVRLLSYANEFDLEGLVATVNKNMHSVHPEVIRNQIEYYGKVLDRLGEHASGWPSEAYLLSRVASSAEGIAMDVVGDGKSTSGSQLIIDAVDADDPRPVWICSWDGLVTLAQALWDVRRDRPDDVEAFVAKLRVYTITEDSDVEPWIRSTFPDLFYVWADRDSTFSGIAEGGDDSMVSDDWVRENIQEGHGPLGRETYPDTKFIMEADTPSVFFL
ncbi:MAG: DUF1593 domain-containing protein, partial [Myxococcales bacterium]|nr:DUF1593 domain-containing protein [Myxococcales bacterium]